MNIQTQNQAFADRKKTAATAAVLAGAGTLALADNANAQAATPATAMSDITAMVTGLGVLAGIALGIALAPRAIAFGNRIIDKVMR